MRIEGRLLDGPMGGRTCALPDFKRNLEVRQARLKVVPEALPWKEGDTLPAMETISHYYEADIVIVQYRWRRPGRDETVTETGSALTGRQETLTP